MSLSTNNNTRSVTLTQAGMFESRRQRAAYHKVKDLQGVERRLLEAHKLSLRKGDTRRAQSYYQQVQAVREERKKWTELLSNEQTIAQTQTLSSSTSSLSSTIPSILLISSSSGSSYNQIIVFAGVVLCIFSPPLFESLTMLSIKRVSHSILLLILLYTGILMSFSCPNISSSFKSEQQLLSRDQSQNIGINTPQPWSAQIASVELNKKSNSLSAKLRYGLRNRL